MSDVNKIVEGIRLGEIDVNNQELFFSTLIKGLLLKLKEDISIRKIPVPHIVVHMGSEAMYLERKGHDMSKEPYNVSNEDWIYQIVPRCIVTPGALDLVPDQLTNPYSIGQLQFEYEDMIYGLKGEFRRMPLKMSVELKYFTDSYRDMLELVQQVITKLSFIRTYDIMYMGQAIKCSYRLPDNFSEEHLTELDGMTQDDRSHTLQVSLEVETNLPVFSPRTMMDAGKIITKPYLNGKYVGSYEIGDQDPNIEGIVIKK